MLSKIENCFERDIEQGNIEFQQLNKNMNSIEQKKNLN